MIYPIFTTSSISGAYFFIVASTPFFKVIWFTEKPLQAPSNCTFTTLPFIDKSLIFPPSFIKKGRISSKAFSTFFCVSCATILYSYFVLHPLIVVIRTTSVGGKFSFLFTN